jgi:hypothetical protein
VVTGLLEPAKKDCVEFFGILAKNDLGNEYPISNSLFLNKISPKI